MTVEERDDGTLVRRQPDPFSAGELVKRYQPTQADFTLGNAPPRTLDSVMSGLVRLHRLYDMDDEDRQSRGTVMGPLPHPDLTRLHLVDQLIEWLKPAVDAERQARESEQDRVDAQAKGQWPG